jgi:hypothetical protein
MVFCNHRTRVRRDNLESLPCEGFRQARIIVLENQRAGRIDGC